MESLEGSNQHQHILCSSICLVIHQSSILHAGGRVVPTAGRGLRKEMNETALKFLTQANRPELWAVFSGWVTELPADRVESEFDRLLMLHQSAIQDPAMQAAMLQYFETVCAKVGIGSVV